MLIDGVGQHLITGTKAYRRHAYAGEVTAVGGKVPDPYWALLAQDLVADRASCHDCRVISRQNVGGVATGYGSIESCIGATLENRDRDLGLGAISNRPIGELL